MPWGAVAKTIYDGYQSDKAADKVAAGAKKGIASTEFLSNRARLDAVNLFNQGRNSALLGKSAAFNLIKQNAQKIASPLIEGNMLAQQAIGRGGIQANNAILGLPVDMSFADNPQQVSADYSGINNAQLPSVASSTNSEGIPNGLSVDESGAQAIGEAQAKIRDEQLSKLIKLNNGPFKEGQKWTNSKIPAPIPEEFQVKPKQIQQIGNDAVSNSQRQQLLGGR